MVAKIVKGIKNIFIKLLARKKSLCIFALGFGITVIQKLEDIQIKILKIQTNEQKNVSTIEKKKKK
jgi:mannose/fructose/N-acetylgalactosamine-specific phosphotransferase system component IIC